MKNKGNQLSNLVALRIYFRANAKPPGLSWWQKIFGPTLSTLLVRAAKDDGIAQAIYYPVGGGYLGSDKAEFLGAEYAPATLPRCVELIDQEEKIDSFLSHYARLLRDSKCIKLRAQLGT